MTEISIQRKYFNYYYNTTEENKQKQDFEKKKMSPKDF